MITTKKLIQKGKLLYKNPRMYVYFKPSTFQCKVYRERQRQSGNPITLQLNGPETLYFKNLEKDFGIIIINPGVSFITPLIIFYKKTYVIFKVEEPETVFHGKYSHWDSDGGSYLVVCYYTDKMVDSIQEMSQMLRSFEIQLGDLRGIDILKHLQPNLHYANLVFVNNYYSAQKLITKLYSKIHKKSMMHEPKLSEPVYLEEYQGPAKLKANMLRLICTTDIIDNLKWRNK